LPPMAFNFQMYVTTAEENAKSHAKQAKPRAQSGDHEPKALNLARVSYWNAAHTHIEVKVATPTKIKLQKETVAARADDTLPNLVMTVKASKANAGNTAITMKKRTAYTLPWLSEIADKVSAQSMLKSHVFQGPTNRPLVLDQ